MKKILSSLFFICLSSVSFGKELNPLCVGVTGSAFTTGTGLYTNPYLICNKLQFLRIAAEPALLLRSFKLGADLDFQGAPFPMIGQRLKPFRGMVFEGDGYTLSGITLQPLPDDTHIGIFRYMHGVIISNLFINGITLDVWGSTTVGGLAGHGAISTVINVHVKNLNMKSPDRSGGLFGLAQRVTLINSSVEGTMSIHGDTDGAGGLIGRADICDVSSCYTKVRIVEVDTTTTGVSNIGGLFGFLYKSNVKNVYALGDIDFSNVTGQLLVISVGGLSGLLESSAISKAYYAGKILIKNGPKFIGGAVGASTGAVADSVIWNIISSRILTSAVGTSAVTCQMSQPAFWIQLGFDTNLWRLMDGTYPKFIWEA